MKKYADSELYPVGYNSIYGGRTPPTIQDAINVLTRAENGNIDELRAIRQSLDILEELV